MVRGSSSTYVNFILLVVLSVTAKIGWSDEGKAIMDPALAGPDLAVQGEYLGKLDTGEADQRWGAQVIALGAGKFRLVGYDGGLPGDGWSRDGRQEVAEGTRDGAVARFSADEWEAEIREGRLTVSSVDGTRLGILEKVTRKSPTLGAKGSEKALVLFDGRSAEQFEHGQLALENLLLAGCSSKVVFGDHKLHLEFRTPLKSSARGQARGNSGVYLQSRYEVQVLDSFGLEGLNNECGGIYKVAQPKVNMCFPPLTWQTYDIEFTAARYEGDRKVKNAHVTVVHNGVCIHEKLELPGATPGRMKEADSQAPLFLQGHGNPVVYRNIWVEPK